MPVDRNAVLRQADKTQADFDASGLSWDVLEAIYADYSTTTTRDQLTVAMSSAASSLQNGPGVHTVRARLKTADSLAVKVIRKRVENPERVVTVDNYRKEFTDLVGLRALHLLKSDWLPIHQFILSKWRPIETPVANIRDGDPHSADLHGCVIRVHPAGYRSVHYLITVRPEIDDIPVEIQVRTLFEEAWSEIDHRIRYPQNQNHLVLSPSLLLFNRYAGAADEMASYVTELRQYTLGAEKELAAAKQMHAEAVAMRDAEVASLKAEIARLSPPPDKAAAIEEKLERALKPLPRVRVPVEFDTSAAGRLARALEDRIGPAFANVLDLTAAHEASHRAAFARAVDLDLDTQMKLGMIESVPLALQKVMGTFGVERVHGLGAIEDEKVIRHLKASGLLPDDEEPKK